MSEFVDTVRFSAERTVKSVLETFVYSPARALTDLVKSPKFGLALGFVGFAVGVGAYFLVDSHIPQAIKVLAMPGAALAGALSGVLVGELLGSKLFFRS